MQGAIDLEASVGVKVLMQNVLDGIGVWNKFGIFQHDSDCFVRMCSAKQGSAQMESHATVL